MVCWDAFIAAHQNVKHLVVMEEICLLVDICDVDRLLAVEDVESFADVLQCEELTEVVLDFNSIGIEYGIDFLLGILAAAVDEEFVLFDVAAQLCVVEFACVFEHLQQV